MNDRLTPMEPRVEVLYLPDRSTRTVTVQRWRIEGATSFAREAHTPVRPASLP